MAHLTSEQLAAHVPAVTASPANNGELVLIVRRPETLAREVVDSADLLVGEGLKGDNYLERGSSTTPDKMAHPEAQLTLMNVHAVNAVADGNRESWPLAGDQLYVDLDLSLANLPPGTRLAIGTAVVEVSRKPHNGCSLFSERFGVDAARWANSDKNLRLRGINAMVIESGQITTGDTCVKLDEMGTGSPET